MLYCDYNEGDSYDTRLARYDYNHFHPSPIFTMSMSLCPMFTVFCKGLLNLSFGGTKRTNANSNLVYTMCKI